MPSSNTTKGTWYESSRASSEWPQYAALSVKVTSEQVCTYALEYALPLWSLCHKKRIQWYPMCLQSYLPATSPVSELTLCNVPELPQAYVAEQGVQLPIAIFTANTAIVYWIDVDN